MRQPQNSQCINSSSSSSSSLFHKRHSILIQKTVLLQKDIVFLHKRYCIVIHTRDIVYDHTDNIVYSYTKDSGHYYMQGITQDYATPKQNTLTTRHKYCIKLQESHWGTYMLFIS